MFIKLIIAAVAAVISTPNAKDRFNSTRIIQVFTLTDNTETTFDFTDQH